MDPHLTTYNATGGLTGIDDRAILSILVAAIKELAAKIAGFAETFTTKELIATNGTFDKLSTKQLCALKSDGTSVCVTGDELSALLSQPAPATTPTSVPSSPSDIREPEATTTPSDLTNSEQPPHENSSTSEPASSSDESASSPEPEVGNASAEAN